MRQIQTDYLPELEREIKPGPAKKKGRKKKVAHLFNVYRLHHARLMDLIKLVELRNYEVTGYRELICFLYRYWSCCYTNDVNEALNQTMMLNLQFTAPLTEKEVRRATKSAEKAWEARNNEEANRIAVEKGYPGAGYNISNKKLISWLDINSEEMKHLQTIIDTPEKNRRKRIANMEMRREQGVKPREVYVKEQHDKTDLNLTQVKELLEKGLKQKEIAEQLGLSKGRISQLVKQI